MQRYKKALGILFCLILTWDTLAQVVYEPTYHTVYPYLSRLAQKGVIELDDAVLPLSKDYIYQKLDELSKHITTLTPLEREELAFYLKEYTLWWRKDPKSGFEGEYKSLFKTKIGDRLRWLTYQDDNFTVNLQPIMGFSYVADLDKNTGYSVNNKGVWMYGFIGKNIGYSIDIRDNTINSLRPVDEVKNTFNSMQGNLGGYLNSQYSYNIVNSSISYKWKKGSVSLNKSSNQIGYGEGGKILLSDKAPSYANFRLDFRPVRWAKYMYLHAWLNSNLIDSSTLITTSVSGLQQFKLQNKYMALHLLTIEPFKRFYFSLGESSIYNYELNPLFFLPVNFFVAMDRYMGGNKNSSPSNSQLFFSLSSRNHLKNTHLYASLFVDELRVSGIFGDSLNNRNHTAYQVGVNVSDIPFRNINFVVEYTKLRPFVYENFVGAQTYTSGGYSLGHWIGANSDQFYASILWRVMRGLQIKYYFSSVRKGSVGTGYQQQYEVGSKFLDKIIKRQIDTGISLLWEYKHDLFFKLNFQAVTTKSYDDLSSETTSNLSTLSFGLNYGF